MTATLRELFAAAYLAALQPVELPPTTRAPLRLDTPDRPTTVPLRGARTEENPR